MIFLFYLRGGVGEVPSVRFGDHSLTFHINTNNLKQKDYARNY